MYSKKSVRGETAPEMGENTDLRNILKLFTDIWAQPAFQAPVLTLAAAFLSALLVYFPATRLAFRVSRMGRRSGRIADTLLLIPMFLPPAAAGFLLLILFGIRSPLGFLLYENLHITVAGTWIGCIAASFVVSFPIMYRFARSGFAHVDQGTVIAARTMGMTDRALFRKIVLPQAREPLLCGMIFTFARAAGEFGATTLIAGNMDGRTGTVSMMIVSLAREGKFGEAFGFVLFMLLFAAVCALILHRAVWGKGKKRAGAQVNR